MLQRINATAFFLSSVVVFAGPPTGYYDLAEGLTGAALKQALHEIIDDHIVISYSRTDEFMRVIDEDPQNSANVGLIYSNFSMSKGALGSSGASVWNREHLWPRSYGIDSSGPDNSDMHNLYPCNASVNSSRSNKYYDETTLPSTVNTVSPENTFDSNSWEPADSDKGIVARAVLYMAARYEGDESATSDLELSDSPNSTAQLMGKLTTMLDWNRKFPPSSAEKIATMPSTLEPLRPQASCVRVIETHSLIILNLLMPSF